MDEFIYFAVLLFLTLTVIGMAYSLVVVAVALLDLRGADKRKGYLVQHPGVSILKPLKGIDDGLEENIQSFFTMDYPQYELIFGVMDRDDPAIEIVRNLQKKYPHIRSSLIINGQKTGLNPKISNLQNIFSHAHHELILISDSNIRAGKEYLREMVYHMQDPKVGLVTSIIRGMGGARFGAVLENLHLNTYIAGNVIAVGHLFNKPITIGKSMLFRKTTITNIGGFAAFKDVLAEDHLIGVYIKRLGFNVRLSHYFVDNINVTWSMGRFINRHLRWAKMRRHLNFGHYLIELLSNPIALSSLYFGIHPGLISASILIGISLIKIAADWALARSLHSDLKPINFLLVPFKDMLLAIIWMIPFFSRHVNWRGNRFRIMNQTVLQPAD